MKVLLATGSFPPHRCGVGDYAERLARALATLPDVEVGVLTSQSAAARETDEPYTVFPVMERWASKERHIAIETVKAFQPDVVHIQYPTLGYHGRLPWNLPHLIPMATGVPVVQTWHEFVPDERERTYRDFAGLVAWGHVIHVREDFVRRMPLWYRLISLHLKFKHIPNAPNLPQIRMEASEREALRKRWAGDRNLVVFFGFPYEHKGIDDLIQAVDPAKDFLLVVGDLKDFDPYQVELKARLQTSPLKDYMHLTGFLPDEEAARLMAAADVVALPFRRGGGAWNTSLQAAQLQGSFVLCTSLDRQGYDATTNTYWARPGDVSSIREGLRAHMGTRLAPEKAGLGLASWETIAQAHRAIYARQCS